MTAATPGEAGRWRGSREPGWTRDVGYTLQTVLSQHRYAIEKKGTKPDDPGWHTCSCGEWEGYWSSFTPHVADHLRAAALADRGAALDQARALIAEAMAWVYCTDVMPSTNPHGIGGQALTACGRCEGCRWAARAAALAEQGDAQ